jgi:hypothetical protein
MRFDPAGDTKELLALHDEMRQAAGGQGDPLRQAVGTIASRYAASHNQSGLIRLRLFQDERQVV